MFKGERKVTAPAHKAELADWDNSALAAFAVREIQRADGGNPHERQDGGEQDDYDQGSLLVLRSGSNSIAKL